MSATYITQCRRSQHPKWARRSALQRLREMPRRSVQLTTPLKIPPAPRPEIARPMMKATEFGAAPQIAEPTSNKKTTMRNTAFTL